MRTLDLIIGNDPFEAVLLDDAAPLTCARFRELLPMRFDLIHARWSGAACWIPLGSLDLDVPLEAPTGEPAPGEVLFYPGGPSETEILVPYGETRFAADCGPLQGTPFLRIIEGLDRLADVGRDILWRGAREIVFSARAA